ncbi:methylated-DNA--[protein]-cysteine S-methyltrans ferase [Desulfonema ishimotonii]|uniref:Methylated-DNA--protein-cysteine methyltransferase n=1 Tax=Desulfonema ishimotonii TaxID=45657 RepID=A0A401FY29_9BACT|nr:methylated-DNA--[protein]-cysteine S-methyltransferase [Desulfonema ishimotonii]GBC61871.1 methylated-DNA--[protein]-cysteine S-methyltrans ferase [Desulfonema ishimotonii]
MYYHYMQSPVGRLLLAGDGAGLSRISFPTGKKPYAPEPGWQENPEALQPVMRELDAYFEGRLKRFSLKLALNVTPFQEKVLRALQDVPYGQTVSYGELARRVGNPKASRAVGMANARNPIPIVIPCHRVIGSSGRLTGYGGGLEIKQTLLDLERRHA